MHFSKYQKLLFWNVTSGEKHYIMELNLTILLFLSKTTAIYVDRSTNLLRIQFDDSTMYKLGLRAI